MRWALPDLAKECSRSQSLRDLVVLVAVVQDRIAEDRMPKSGDDSAS
eukprot:gene225-726_t